MIVALLLLQATAASAGVAQQPGLSYPSCLRAEGVNLPGKAPEARWRAAWADAVKACRGNRLAWSRYRLHRLTAGHPERADARVLNKIELVTLDMEADAYARFRHPILIGQTFYDRFLWN